jgi:hypothetical protein
VKPTDGPAGSDKEHGLSSLVAWAVVGSVVFFVPPEISQVLHDY